VAVSPSEVKSTRGEGHNVYGGVQIVALHSGRLWEFQLKSLKPRSFPYYITSHVARIFPVYKLLPSLGNFKRDLWYPTRILPLGPAILSRCSRVPSFAYNRTLRWFRILDEGNLNERIPSRTTRVFDTEFVYVGPFARGIGRPSLLGS